MIAVGIIVGCKSFQCKWGWLGPDKRQSLYLVIQTGKQRNEESYLWSHTRKWDREEPRNPVMEGLWELPKSPFTSHSHHPWQKGHGWSQATAGYPFNSLPGHIVPQTSMNCKCSMRNIFLVFILMYLLKRKMAASIREAAFTSCFVFHLLPSVEQWNRVANLGETWHRWTTLQQAGPEEQLGPPVVIETHNAFILLSQWLLVSVGPLIPSHHTVLFTPRQHGTLRKMVFGFPMLSSKIHLPMYPESPPPRWISETLRYWVLLCHVCRPCMFTDNTCLKKSYFPSFNSIS